MASECNHPVGYIPPSEAFSDDWNDRIVAFAAKVEDFNVRGQRMQVNHPGFLVEFNFCPNCGRSIDRSALGLMSFADAFKKLT